MNATVTFCRKTGKLGYLSEEHANQAARRLLRVANYRPYLCEFCSWWHLTTQRGRHDRTRHV